MSSTKINDLSEQDSKELTETFNEWFRDVHHNQPTAAMRMVLWESRPTLLENWLRVRPTYTTSELAEAKTKAKELRERILK